MAESRFSKFFIIPQREILAIMVFLAITIAYMMRACLPFAMLTMVLPGNNKYPPMPPIRPIPPPGPIPPPPPPPPLFLYLDYFLKAVHLYNWEPSTQGLILGSFYIGYVIMLVPGTFLVEKFGGKYSLLFSMLANTLVAALFPVAIDEGKKTAYIVILYVVLGLSQGLLYPASSKLITSWTPTKDRAKVHGFVFSGSIIGTFVGFLITGFIVHKRHSADWAFYIFAIFSILWLIAFALICYETAALHPFISEKEREHLNAENSPPKRKNDSQLQVWLSIIKSIPVIALIAAQVGYDWGFYSMISHLPRFIYTNIFALEFPPKPFNFQDIGLLSSLPFLFMWIVAVLSIFCSERLTTRNINITILVRKIFVCIGAMSAIFMVAAAYFCCEKITVVILFTFAMVFMGVHYTSTVLNPFDLSENYATYVLAITHGIGGITGLIAPWVAGAIANYNSPGEQIKKDWAIVFWITFAISILTTIVYSVWASAKRQFNAIDEPKDDSGSSRKPISSPESDQILE